MRLRFDQPRNLYVILNVTMARPLEGVRVVTTENRYPEQLAQLLSRQGAIVLSYPLLKETPTEDAEGARRFIGICESQRVDYIVFYTGVGVDFLFRAANRPDLIARSRILARGPKAVNALRRAGLEPNLVAAAATTEGIIQTLSREDLAGKSVLVQLYGRENPELQHALESRGAAMFGVSLYSYTEASDPAAIRDLCAKLEAREVDAITFTSATQVPFLMASAAGFTDITGFRRRLNDDVVVASVGEVTSRALREAGIEPRVEPAESKMGPMVRALADFFEERNK